MKIQPMASPQAAPVPTSGNQDARARAIAMVSQQAQSQETAVLDPNNVSPEEMSAIRAPTGQTDTEESQVAEETAEKPKRPEDEDLKRRFAQLARQEKAVRAQRQQMEQQIKAREAAIAAREAELTAKDQQYSTGYLSKDRLKQETLQVLAEAGVSYDDLTSQILNQQPVDPRMQATIRQLEAKIESLQKHNETSQQSYKEQQAEQYKAAVKQIELDAKTLVQQDPNFETVKATGSVRDIVELITQTYDKDGILLSVEEAAQQVEDYLVEEAMKFTKIDKIKKRIAENASKSQQVAKAQTPAQTAPKQPQTMKTLTNASGSSRQLSAKERALLAFKGEKF